MKLNSSLTVDGLAELLGTSYIKIKHFYYNTNPSAYYSKFEINKKSGGKREILAPEERLKTLQRRLKVLLEEIYIPKKQVNAFVKNKSIVSNAKSHTRKKYVFNLDLENFFPTISFARVRGLLIAKPYSLQPNVASVIAHLSTVDGYLPQGSPCSPVLSNMICRSMDRQLFSFAIKHRAEYSRYADDITFSFYDELKFISDEVLTCLEGDGLPNHYHCKVGIGLESIISNSGFSINKSKIRLQSRHERQTVTGLVVNKKANVNRQYIRKTSAMIYSISKYGIDTAREIFKSKGKDSTAILDAHLQGRLLFIKQVVSTNSDVYQRLAINFNLLDLDHKVPLRKSKNVRGVESRKYSKWYDERCWVIESEWNPPHEYDYAQGTGFTISRNLVVTCAHVVKKIRGDNASEVTIFRASNRGEKVKARIVVCDEHRDLAILEIMISPAKMLPYFELSDSTTDIGDSVDILGFPKDKLGARHVGRQKCSIRNSFPISAVTIFEIDKELYAGNSGGPVLNDDGDIVGVVTKGNNDEGFNGHSQFTCVSELKKIIPPVVLVAETA